VNLQGKPVVQPHREKIDDAMMAKFTTKHKDVCRTRSCGTGPTTEWLVRLEGAAGTSPVILSGQAYERMLAFANAHGFSWPAIPDLSPVEAGSLSKALDHALQRELVLSEGDRAVMLAVSNLCGEGRSVKVTRQRRD
jgi:hypothetical protein